MRMLARYANLTSFTGGSEMRPYQLKHNVQGWSWEVYVKASPLRPQTFKQIKCR